MPYVPDLGPLLTAGYRVERDGIVYVVEPYELGPVVLPTGKVVGCAPLVPQATPFVDVVAPGRYPLAGLGGGFVQGRLGVTTTDSRTAAGSPG